MVQKIEQLTLFKRTGECAQSIQADSMLHYERGLLFTDLRVIRLQKEKDIRNITWLSNSS